MNRTDRPAQALEARQRVEEGLEALRLGLVPYPVVERNDEGHTEITRLRPNKEMSREDWHEAANGRSLSQLWLDGWILGALGRSVQVMRLGPESTRCRALG